MATTGNVFPGTGENNAGIGATAWTNPGNITADDGTDAGNTASASSQYLVARNFNFSGLPSNAIIKGVLVRIEASEHSGGTEALLAQLQNETGTLFGTGKTNTNEGNLSGTAKSVYTFGSTSDLWGASLTRAIVTDADFGVRFWYTTGHTVNVDFVTMAITYGYELTIGLGETTDTSLSLTITKIRATGLATETDSAVTKAAFTKISSETDTAFQLTLAEAQYPGLFMPRQFIWGDVSGIYVPTGRADEADVAYTLGRVKFALTVLAEETDSSQVLAAARLKSPGIGEETDSSLQLIHKKLRATGLTEETDEAIPLVHGQAIATGLSEETDSALSLVRLKTYTLSFGEETDGSLPLTLGFIGGAGLFPPFGFSWGNIFGVQVAEETDTAITLGVAIGGAGFFFPHRFYAGSTAVALSVKMAEETDTALPIVMSLDPYMFDMGIGGEDYISYSPARIKLRAIGRAEETDTALPLFIQEYVAVGLAQESDQAVALTLQSRPQYQTDFASEVDAAFVLPQTKTYGYSPALGTDAAQMLAMAHLRGVGISVETDEAFSLGFTDFIYTGIAEEVDFALAVPASVGADIITIGDVTETDVSLSLLIVKYRTVEMSEEFDTPEPLGLYRVNNIVVYAWRRLS